MRYLTGCIFAMLVWSKRCISAPANTSPISVLKPLCGMEPDLYDNLRSFCTQNYPEFQIIFGAESLDDPVLAVARELQIEFLHLDIQIVSGGNIRCALFVFLLSIREGISFTVWLGSYFGRHVHWRGHAFAVRQDGYMEEVR